MRNAIPKKLLTSVLWMWWALLAIVLGARIANSDRIENRLPAISTPILTSNLTAAQNTTSRTAPPEFHDLNNHFPAAHSSTVITLSNGDLLAAWFAGSREGASDVVISSARFHAGQWSEPQTLITRHDVARSRWEYNKKVGNPLLFIDPNNRVHLIFVSVSLGGWAGSRLNHSVSHDEGISWSAPERLYLSPWFNVSTLVRNGVSPTTYGFALPVYHELIRKYPQVIWFDHEMRSYQQTRMAQNLSFTNLFSIVPNTLQPALIGNPPQHPGAKANWQAWLRNGQGDTDTPKVGYQESHDGKNWSAPDWLKVPNRDSALTVVRGNAETLIMAYNDGEKGNARARLILASSNNGIDWTPRLLVENHTQGEFSYPSLSVHEDKLDLLYTYQRQHIKHMRVGLDWLMSQKPPIP